MSGEDTNPPRNTSYNKYSGRTGEGHDKNIGPENEIPQPERYTRDMSPFSLYSAEEMALLVRKSPITVRLEARRIHAGVKKDGRWFFSSEDRDRLHQSFVSKKRQISPDNNSPLLGSILERQDFLARRIKELESDRVRSAYLFKDVHDEWMRRFEEGNQRFDELERKVRKLGEEKKTGP
jgi:hypothetical protein